jgi:ABC-2 type transport system permease protein
MNTTTRILTIVWGEVLHLRRNKISLAFLILLPTVSIVIMNSAFGEVTNIPVLVSNQDDGKAADILVSSIKATSTFKVVMEGNITEQDSREFVLDREVRMSLVIPPGFSKDVEDGNNGTLKAMLDGTDQSIYLSMSVGLSDAVQKAAKEIVEEKMGGGIETTIVDLKREKVYGENLRSIDQMAPVMIAFFLTYICMNNTSLAVVREKVEGTIERLLLTPTRGSEIILGKLFYGVIVATGEISLLLFLGVGVYKIRVVGDLFLVFSVGILTGLGGLGMGLVASSVSRTELEALLWQAGYIVPAMLLSGLIYPIEAMSPSLQLLANLVPMTHAIRALKAVMISGLGISSIIVQVSALSIFAAIMLVLGVALFRMEMISRI